jgi:arylsulfatase A-like enzyme
MNSTGRGRWEGILKTVLIMLLVATLYGCDGQTLEDSSQPNILSITSEDNSPILGVYGDEYAETPNIDRLADRGSVYENAYATTPVCAPARFTLITGTYANRMGTENMRSTYPIPPDIQFFPKYLQEAGYHTTNNQKKDYNTVDQPEAWDVSSGEAHYRDRDEGQPFFHVRNIFVSHESSLHDPIDTLIHDPEQAPVPPYHPETEAIKKDWAHYYDEVTRMDEQVGEILDELKESGEAENTIVFYYGDHGGAVPGSKRFMNQRGLQVPLIVYIPPKYEHLAPDEKRTDRLVSFVDFPATVLSLVGIEPPEYMDGKPFLGKYAEEPREYVHTYRGRMDERYDLVRAVHDKDMLYVRNYMPQRIYGQHLWYLWRAPTMQSWEEEYQKGNLNEIQRRFFEEKPAEELYNLAEDPYTVHNLAQNPEYQDDLKRLRNANKEWIRNKNDLGFIPEGIIDDVRGERTLYEAVREDNIPLEEIIETAEMASLNAHENITRLAERLDHEDPSVRFWAAMGLVNAQDQASDYAEELIQKTNDPSGVVRVAVAEALYEIGRQDVAFRIIEEVLQNRDEHVKLRALNMLEAIDTESFTASLSSVIQSLFEHYSDTEGATEGAGSYVFRASEQLLKE